MNIKIYVDYGEKSEVILKIIKPQIDAIRGAGHIITVIKITPKDKNMKVPTLTTSSGVNVVGINAIRAFLGDISMKMIKEQKGAGAGARGSSNGMPQRRKIESTDDYMNNLIMSGDDENFKNDDDDGFQTREASEMQNALTAELNRRSSSMPKNPARGGSSRLPKAQQPQQSQQSRVQQMMASRIENNDENKFIMGNTKPATAAPSKPIFNAKPTKSKMAMTEDERDDDLMRNMLETDYNVE